LNGRGAAEACAVIRLDGATHRTQWNQSKTNPSFNGDDQVTCSLVSLVQSRCVLPVLRRCSWVCLSPSAFSTRRSLARSSDHPSPNNNQATRDHQRRPLERNATGTTHDTVDSPKFVPSIEHPRRPQSAYESTCRRRRGYQYRPSPHRIGDS
jgi:hypothetical protein